ncbi:MMPL family transporter [bacterium]|nr:MMPL family transporter [bacterium]
MVQKVKVVILFLITVLMIFLSLSVKGNVETNMLKTLLPQNIIASTDIVPLANKSASVIKVVFEADDEDSLETLKEKFTEQIDKNYFEINNPDISPLLEQYLKNPTNFISDETRKLLKNKKYDEIYSKSIETLYNPTGIQLSPLDKDPYLLLDDFIMQNRKMSPDLSEEENKYYSTMSLKIKSEEGLSPEISNKKISEIVKSQKELNTGNTKIYLAGNPIHSYHTSIKSKTDINVICILSIFLIICLTYLYFRNIKMLLPIALSIMFGMLSGYTATKLWFEDFQIITMVFSATLIGIGIDYSYHYFFSKNRETLFVKNLSFSLITTIIPFALLYLTGIELLKQISVFTVFGLLAIYSAVLIIYPCFKLPDSKFSVRINTKIYGVILIAVVILSLAGFCRLRFNDSLNSLYIPAKELLKAETLYNKIAGDNYQNTQILTLKGENSQDIIEKEEAVTEKLNKDNIDYISLSKFIPSEKRQKENFELVKDLYANNLNKYSDILSSNQIRNLINSKFIPVYFDIKNYPYLSSFMLNENTSVIFVFSDKKPNITDDGVSIVNLKSDIEIYMKQYRETLLKLFPVVILVLFLLLVYIYGLKRVVKIITPPLVGILCATGLNCLVCGELNLFSIISLFLVLGFTMDYSIFRTDGEEQTEDAVLVSCITTSFSFLLLSLCGFKLLSSIALILFFGIVISYITGHIIWSKK